MLGGVPAKAKAANKVPKEGVARALVARAFIASGEVTPSG
jgi:hypothetical protein